MTEIHFWLIACLMMLGSALWFVYPLVKKDKTSQNEAASRDELNKALYRDRMAELAEESKEGLVDNQAELEVELKQSLLDDIPLQSVKDDDLHSQVTYVLPGLILFIGIVFGTYYFVGNQTKVSDWQETAQQLPELSARMMADAQDPMTDQEMSDMTLALRTQLQKTPDDGMGWLLLGRIALANRDIQTAEGAMAKAYRLLPTDSDVILGYAQSLMLTGDETNTQVARGLLNRLIAQDHQNLQALSLLAFEAFERGAYEEAKAAWMTMQQLLPKDDPRHAMLERSIARADVHLNQGQGQSATVTISVPEGVRLPDEGILFVSVHSADGAPMPIAAKRLPLSQFPLKVELTDADSMIPERLLSSLSEVMFKARIDLDGNVMTKEGWSGQSSPISLGEMTTLRLEPPSN